MNFVNSLDARVGRKVHAARESQNLSAEDFAHALNIPVRKLSKLESGAKRFNPILLFKALKTLSLDMKDLFVDLPLQKQCGNVRLSFDARTISANRSAI
jgi:transcriptional regulator with XRE-family HTH domain